MPASTEVYRPAIVVDDLHKRYGRIDALKGVALNVREGEIFGLLGANGAGKSTLMRILVGGTRSTAGHVQVLGYDPAKEPRRLRRELGYMPQAPALYEDLTARDNVRFFGQAHRLPDLNRRTDDVLAFTNLGQRAEDLVYRFSGGMKQRVSLACALVHSPRLLLLDEPTAGIDPQLREAFWQHFRRLAADGVTVLISTHQLDEALHCDRVAIMRDGVILACDTPRSLLQRGRATVRIWHGESVEEVRLAGYADALPAVLQRYGLAPAVTRIEIEEDTLESVVLDLIQSSQPAREAVGEARNVVHA